MLTGANATTTGSMGHPKTPTPSTVNATIAIAAGSGVPCATALMPLDKVSPTTAAATPSSTASTPGTSAIRP